MQEMGRNRLDEIALRAYGLDPNLAHEVNGCVSELITLRRKKSEAVS